MSSTLNFLSSALAALVLVSGATQSLVARQTPEPTLVSLKDFASAEVRYQGFYLSEAAKVHVYAKGSGVSAEHDWSDHSRMYAYGWILDSTTRKVVWEMTYETSKKEGPYRVADHYLDLPKGSYEAYFSDHGYARDSSFFKATANIDRRESTETDKRSKPSAWRHLFGLNGHGSKDAWRHEVGNYGMEIYAASTAAQSATRFEAPLMWKNIVLSLHKVGDNSCQVQAFHCSKPMEIHLYAIGEGSRHDGMNDYGWILDAKTRKRVWEMRADKLHWAGGAEKNRMIMERINLPAGEYVAYFLSDDSHSPEDWNAAPPTDPLNYGLCLALPHEADLASFKLTEIKEPGRVVAQLARVQDDQNYSAPFTLAQETRLRIYALGEGGERRLYDYGWIEERATGKQVWTMNNRETHHAGGASKNRMLDEVITLPKGDYVLKYRTDESHAYGDWNDDAPLDPDHYGITVYEAEK